MVKKNDGSTFEMDERLIRKQLAQSRKKIKSNKKNIPARDQCQTPPIALLPLLPYIPKEWIVWESAAGEGLLAQGTRKLSGSDVIETDLERGVNFFDTSLSIGYDMQITNPPFSLKYDWLKKSYENAKPFALLMPFDTWAAGTAQKLFQEFGICVILFNRRINFKMPNKGWAGSGSDYNVAWFCWGLPNLREPVTYGHIPLAKTLPDWMTKPNNKDEIINA